MMSFFAQADPALWGDLLKVLTGAGGSIVCMWLWNRREVQRADESEAKATKSAEEVSDLAKEAIRAITENGNYIANNTTEIAALRQQIANQSQTANHE